MMLIVKTADLDQHPIVDMELIVTEMVGIFADNCATVRKTAEYSSSSFICDYADPGAAHRMPDSRVCIGIRTNVFCRQSNGIFINLCDNGVHGLTNMVYFPQIA